MKRIHSIDFCRGYAIFIMLFLHGFTNYSVELAGMATNMGSESFLLFFVRFHARFAGFFFMVSGTSNAFSFYKRIKKGKTTGKNLWKQSMIIGATLTILGKVIGSLFGRSSSFTTAEGDSINYSIFGSLIEIGELKFPLVEFIFYFMGALQFLGISMMIYGSVLALLFNKTGFKKNQRNFIILIILMLSFFIISPIIIPGLREIWLESLEQGKPIKTILIGVLVADTHSLLPSLGYSFFGCIIGLAFAAEIPYKRFCRFMFSFGFIAFAVALILFLILGFPSPESLLEPVDPLTMTCHIIYISFKLGIFYYLEMGPKPLPERSFLRSKFFKRLGLLSLTIYTMESFLAICIKFLILDPLFPDWSYSIGWVIIYDIALISLWYLIATKWEKAKGLGSLEWFISLLKPKPPKELILSEDPRQIQPIPQPPIEHN